MVNVKHRHAGAAAEMPAGPPLRHLQAQAIAVRRHEKGAVIKDALTGARLALAEEQPIQHLQSLGARTCCSYCNDPR